MKKHLIFTFFILFCLSWSKLLGQSTLLGQGAIISRQNGGENSITLKGEFDNLAITGIRSGGTLAVPTATPQGVKLLSFEGSGHTGAEFVSPRATLDFKTTQTWSPTANGSNLSFSTTENGSNTLTRRMLFENGNLAIGSHVPLTRFHVQDGVSGVAPNTNTSGFFERNNINYIQLGSPDGNSLGVLFGTPSGGPRGGGIVYTGDRNMQFNTNNGTTKMFITELGKVGIGTIVPDTKLEVAGSFAISSKTILTGLNHNYNINGKSVIYANGAPAILSGIDGGTDGLMVYIYAESGTDLFIYNNNTNSLAANRIVTGTGGNLNIFGGGGAILIYDSTDSVWRVIGFKE